MKLILVCLTLGVFLCSGQSTEKKTNPLRIGIAGLQHDHVHWIFGSASRNEIEIVGIAEADPALVERYQKQYHFSSDLVSPTLKEMLDRAKPEAVTAFTSIHDHLEVVKTCAPRHIHVMVEKPLAVSLDHARQIEALAKKNNIHVLTNYETTWYASHYEAYTRIFEENRIGELRKIVVHDGHEGPKEIGVSQEFFRWLTDPVQNGGGAIVDFGCYGTDLITWLMRGARPESVTAITQQIKPDIYPKVDDEATIIVTYPKTQGIIQASWNWPFGRKDIEIYGQTGYMKADRTSLTMRAGEEPEVVKPLTVLPPPMDNPFAYLAGVIRGTITVKDTDLSSLALNMTAMEILDAARQSAREGKTIRLVKK